jgi:hypothetical protein
VHQVRDWYSGAAAYFGRIREAKRENTRCGLRPMSDKAAGQKTRGPEGCRYTSHGLGTLVVVTLGIEYSEAQFELSTKAVSTDPVNAVSHFLKCYGVSSKRGDQQSCSTR